MSLIFSAVGCPPCPRASCRPFAASVVSGAATGLLVACGGGAHGNAASAVNIVATTTQLGDIAGTGADVTQILRPNTDPHAGGGVRGEAAGPGVIREPRSGCDDCPSVGLI